MASQLSRKDQLRLAIYNEVCQYIRVGDGVAYTVISITYPTAFALFGWAINQFGGLWNVGTFFTSFIALSWLLLGRSIFWQIHYKSRVRIELAKRIEDQLGLEVLGLRHLTGPGLDYERKFKLASELKLAEKWRNYRPWFINGLSNTIRNNIPKVVIILWIMYALLFGLRLFGIIDISTMLPDWDMALFLITVLSAATIFGWDLGKRNRHTKGRDGI